MTIRRTSLRLRGLKRFTRKATRMTLATRARAPMCESAKLGIGRPTLARTAAKDASGGLGELELLSLTGGVEAAQERSHRLEPPPRGEAILQPPDEPRCEAASAPPCPPPRAAAGKRAPSLRTTLAGRLFAIRYRSPGSVPSGWAKLTLS